MYPPILLKIVSISKKDALLSGQFQKSTKSHRRSLKKSGIFINLKSNDFYILISLCLPEKAFLFNFFYQAARNIQHHCIQLLFHLFNLFLKKESISYFLYFFIYTDRSHVNIKIIMID